MSGGRGGLPLSRRQITVLASAFITRAVMWLGVWTVTKSAFIASAAWSHIRLTANPKRPRKGIMPSPTTSEDPYRLPRQVVPAHYDLRIEPDFSSHSFTGHEVVTLTVV